MKSITQIAKDLNISKRTVAYRFEKLGIKGKKRILVYYFTKKEVDRISFKRYKNESNPLFSDPNSYSDQVKIIEIYLRLGKRSCVEISKLTGICYWTCGRVVRLFKERDCIIIKSRL